MAQPTHNTKMSAENQDNIHEDHDCQIPSKNKDWLMLGFLGLDFLWFFLIFFYLACGLGVCLGFCFGLGVFCLWTQT